MNQQSMPQGPLDNLGPRPAPAGGRGSAASYILTALVSILVTFALTLSAGAWIFLRWGHQLPQLGVVGGQLPLSFTDNETNAAALDKLRSVYQTLSDNYYKELSEPELIEAMTRGLVNEMDSPYTMYLDAEQTRQIAESMSGNYVGIGAIVAFNTNGLVEVTEVVPGGPAEDSDIRAGDLFLKVNGQSVEGLSDVNEIAVLVRGEAGTTVDLEMFRPSTRQTYTVSAVRRKIVSASVSHRMIDDQIGYVRISEFSTGVAEQFRLAVEDLKNQGAENLVVDLRNNSGGLAHEVIDMLDYLLPKAEIARIEGRNRGKPFRESWTSAPSQGVPPGMRYAVLINRYSASASELFAGCLRDLDYARLIGEQSYGKGSGTVTFDLSDGSSLNVTNFLYYLPAGDSIEGVGLQPDDLVTLPEATAGKSIPQLRDGEDTQLEAALEYLRQGPGLS
jgi:carboxyl-terminal processing protease